jgi:hypothetical protein
VFFLPVWASARTLVSFAAAAALLAAFVAIERRVPAPLVRLGILRSGSLVRANLGAMPLIGGWFGFQFIATLYLQQLRGWSALETGLTIFPGGMLVALPAPRVAPLVTRFGVSRLILVGLCSTAVAYTLFLPVDLDSSYLPSMLATFLFGGALVLAVATAVNNATTGPGGTPQALLEGFHAAWVASLVAALLGVGTVALGLRTPRPRVSHAPAVPDATGSTEDRAVADLRRWERFRRRHLSDTNRARRQRSRAVEAEE